MRISTRLLATALFCLAPVLHAAAPSFEGDAEIASDTGNTLLSWQSDEPVTLTISRKGAARPLYRGSETSYFLTGLADGDYVLKLEGESGARSAPVTLAVRHQSLAQALWLTLVGAMIALSILVVIVRGAHND